MTTAMWLKQIEGLKDTLNRKRNMTFFFKCDFYMVNFENLFQVCKSKYSRTCWQRPKLQGTLKHSLIRDPKRQLHWMLRVAIANHCHENQNAHASPEGYKNQLELHVLAFVIWTHQVWLDWQQCKREQAIGCLQVGQHALVVAKAYNVHVNTIYHWQQWYNKHQQHCRPCLQSVLLDDYTQAGSLNSPATPPWLPTRQLTRPLILDSRPISNNAIQQWLSTNNLHCHH